MGEIMSMEEQTACWRYIIDDGTEVISIRRFKEMKSTGPDEPNVRAD